MTDAELRALYELLRLAPTSANTSPARFLFLRSHVPSEAAVACIVPGNVDKTMTAPVVAIVGHDPRFYDQLPHLFPHGDARAWFTSNPTLATETAFRNGTLQGAYMILAARSIGLDCGPMSGFNKTVVDRDIMADYGWKSNFIVNIGHGDPAGVYPRSPRLEFEQACVLL